MRKLDGTTLNGKKIRLIDVRYVSNSVLCNWRLLISILKEIVLLNSLTHWALVFLQEKASGFWTKLNNEENNRLMLVFQIQLLM